MKFIEGLVSFFAVGMLFYSNYLVIKSMDFSPINCFIIGLSLAVIFHVIKARNDSAARDKYNLPKGD